MEDKFFWKILHHIYTLEGELLLVEVECPFFFGRLDVFSFSNNASSFMNISEGHGDVL